MTPFGNLSNGGCESYSSYEPVHEVPQAFFITDGSAEIELGSCETLCFIVRPESEEFRLELDFEEFGLDDAWMWSDIHIAQARDDEPSNFCEPYDDI